MKSKIYSSRYMKVSSKGMMWIPAFVTIGFLLAFPVAELIMLGNWFGMGYTTREINALYANLWQDGFMLTGLAIAAIAGILLNIILPGNDYEFGVNPAGDENRGIHA